MKKIKLLGISGSARTGSYNTAIIKYLEKNHNENIDFEMLDISKLPMFNQDLEADLPDVVKEFIEKIKQADGFIISTPEHNFSIPALLKNALDWGSRGETTGFDKKYVGIVSASPSMLGGARVQYHLRQVCVCLNLNAVNQPEVFIAKAHEKIDENGIVTDEFTKKMLAKLLEEVIYNIKKDIV